MTNKTNRPTIYKKADLNKLTLKQITEHNNSLCELTGEKPTKRFSTKGAAINKALVNQEIFVEKEKEKSAETFTRFIELTEPKPKAKKVNKKAEVKAKKSTIRDKNVSIIGGEPKEGSTEYVMFQGINDLEVKTVQDLIDYIKYNYERPSGQEMTDTIILRRIRKAVANNHLQLED